MGLASNRHRELLPDRGSSGPWLPHRLFCPAGSSLTMATSAPLRATRRLMTYSARLRVQPASRRGSPIYSASPFTPCRRPYSGGPRDCAQRCLHRRFCLHPLCTQTYVILLANSVHPDARPSLVPLRAKVATIAAAAVGITVRGLTLTGYNETLSGAGARREVGRNGATKTGLDLLVEQKFAPLAGKRVGDRKSTRLNS